MLLREFLQVIFRPNCCRLASKRVFVWMVMTAKIDVAYPSEGPNQ